MWSTLLGVAKAGNLNLDFMAQKHRNSLFCFEYTFRCYRDTKTLKKIWPYRHFKEERFFEKVLMFLIIVKRNRFFREEPLCQL